MDLEENETRARSKRAVVRSEQLVQHANSNGKTSISVVARSRQPSRERQGRENHERGSIAKGGSNSQIHRRSDQSITTGRSRQVKKKVNLSFAFRHFETTKQRSLKFRSRVMTIIYDSLTCRSIYQGMITLSLSR